MHQLPRGRFSSSATGCHVHTGAGFFFTTFSETLPRTGLNRGMDRVDGPCMNRTPPDPREGISILEGSEVPFTDFLASQGARALGSLPELGILVKALDSAIRLSVQAHPDKAFAWRHLGSEHGKTEAWLVLATRQSAHIHFGFRERVTRHQFLEAVEASQSDPQAMPRC